MRDLSRFTAALALWALSGCSSSGDIHIVGGTSASGTSGGTTATAAASGATASSGSVASTTAAASATSSSGTHGASGASSASGSATAASSGSSSGTSGGSPGTTTLSARLRVNNFGWRTADTKVAVLLGTGSASVDLVDATTDTIVGTYTSSALQTETVYSNDSYSSVDFSAYTTAGSYYLAVPALGIRSYPFDLADDVYDIVGAVAAKMYYFARCNDSKAMPYASDALGKFAGIGGQWVDGACHGGDSAATAGPGSAADGTLDLHGGWHDAGDYQKTLWARGVDQLLFAYEANPSAWTDGQLNIPESGNGIPDLLDQAQWELDFYVRMQRPDGHFLTSVKGNNATVDSPPSAANETRVYFDGTSPSGNGWSGGGVTTAEATGNAVLALAHAAVVFKSLGVAAATATANRYQTAATLGWTWLNGQTLTGSENQIKLSAASAVYRMDSTQTTAKTFFEAVDWTTFDGQFPYISDPSEATLSPGAWNYLLNSAGSSTIKQAIQAGVASGIVDNAFNTDGPYGGMNGCGPNGTNGCPNSWDWSWGSNRAQAMYGANLLMAVKFGILGSHTQADIETLALKHLHFMLGLNPLNMVYLTNMAAYGGEHSSFQIFNSWFSFTGGNGQGSADYNGKPTAVTEPLYPYNPADTETSTYGPAPGYVPGGPNVGYDGAATVPNLSWPGYAYRDLSIEGSSYNYNPWELTEPDVNYQGAMVMLLSFVM